MRHRIAGRKLGRTTSHRIAMLRNLVSSLLEHEKVRTTDAKAKEVRPLAEKLIGEGKEEAKKAKGKKKSEKVKRSQRAKLPEAPAKP